MPFLDINDSTDFETWDDLVFLFNEEFADIEFTPAEEEMLKPDPVTLDGEPFCAYCYRTANQITEYWPEITGALATAEAQVKMDGTYNPEKNQFCCTECYISIGMPSNPWGWTV